MGSVRERKKPDGSIVYYAEMRKVGMPSQRANFPTKSAARKWLQNLEQEVSEGRMPQFMETQKHTVGDVIHRYCDEMAVRHPERLSAQLHYYVWWEQLYEKLPLEQLSPALLCKARDTLAAGCVSGGKQRNPATVNRYLAALSSALNAAVKEWQWIESNPMRRITKLRESQGRDRFLSPQERERLLQECRLSSNPNLYPIVVIALVSGMRYGEIVGLTWRDVDLERGMAKLRKTKNGDVRVVPLSSEAQATLRALPTFGQSPDQYLFHSHKAQSSTLSGVHIRGSFEGACKRAGLDDFRFHDLRHTAASYLAMNGATQGELMAVLGHRCPTMTRRYAHYAQDHLMKLVEKNRLGIPLPSTDR